MITKTMISATQRPEVRYQRIANDLAASDYAVTDDFFLPGEVQLLVRQLTNLHQHGALQLAGIGTRQKHQTLQTVRGDVIRWIEEGTSEAGDLFLHRIEELVLFLNRSCYFGIRDTEFHFALYPEGAFYKRHTDNFQQSSKRILSVVCYLNENWHTSDGGQLRLYLPQAGGLESAIDIDPKGGRMVCFFSQIEHEVLPATRQRMSVTGWLLNEKSFFK